MAGRTQPNPGRRRKRRRLMRTRPETLPRLGTLEPEALVEHRELAAARHPSPERLRKLAEARARLARSLGDDRPAA